MPCCDYPCSDCQDRVRRTLEGDEAAFGELFTHFDGLILHIVREKLGARRSSDWDDCAQEVRVRLWRGLRSWGRGRFCAWVSTVAANTATDRVRGDRRATRPLPPDLLAAGAGPDHRRVGGGGGPIARRIPAALPADPGREGESGDRRRTRHRNQKSLLYIIQIKMLLN